MKHTIKNRDQAITEAQRRWGRLANAWILVGTHYVSQDVTLGNPGPGWNHFDGKGTTWDEAFDDAERRIGVHDRAVQA